MKFKRWEYRHKDTVLVFRYGPTSNAKIVDGNGAIIQTYTYSLEQLQAIQVGESWKALLSKDAANCLDCPFSNTNNYSAGKCYVHKYPQARGLAAQLRSVLSLYDNDINLIPPLLDQPPSDLLHLCRNRYVRFGTYGEPVLIPIDWVAAMAGASNRNWTGYTHQWAKDEYQDYRNYFMASIHSSFELVAAEAMGWRTYMAATDTISEVLCPTVSHGTNCSVCRLCSGSGASSIGTKHIYIPLH